jgi:hypothetical protein
MKTHFAALALSIVLAACASSSATDGATGSNASPVAATKAEPAPDLSGTWAFVLASSDVAVPLREKCAKSSANDAAKSQACWDEIAQEAAREKIRFTKNTAGETVWTSFGSEGAKEIVFVQVPVELASDGPGHVLAKVAGTPKGDMAAQFAKASINVMRIELVDARTIAMNDSKKGRLVYTKE